MDGCEEDSKLKHLLTKELFALYILWIFISSKRASGTKCTTHYDAIRSNATSLGELKSPNFGISAYPRGMCFTYQILARANEIIHLKLIHFDVGKERAGTGCLTDFVDIYMEGYYLHRLCGDRSGSEIRGNTNITLVLYSLSNNNISALQSPRHSTGFRIFYEFQYKVNCGTITFNSQDHRSNIISSPGYDTTGYLPLTECTYELVGSPHERIVLQFLDVDLAVSSACHEDYIAVFNVFHQRPSLILEHFCGSPKLEQLISDSNQIKIRFRSAAIRWEKYRGFKVKYTFIRIEELARAETDVAHCGTDFFAGWAGEIKSPGFSATSVPSPKLMKCAWIIRVPDGWQVMLNIVRLKLKKSAPCSSLFLTIYDGFPTRDQDPRDKFCGLTGNVEHDIQIVSQANVVFLRFHANDNLLASYGSFRIVYTATISKFDTCPGFQCNGATRCRDAAKLSCTHLPRYCLHKSAKCNGLESCPLIDGSDEQDCISPLFLVYTIGGASFAALVITATIVMVVLKCRKRRRQSKVMESGMQPSSLYSASNGSLRPRASPKSSLTDLELHTTNNRKPILKLTFADDLGHEVTREIHSPPDSPKKFAKISGPFNSRSTGDFSSVRYTPAPTLNHSEMHNNRGGTLYHAILPNNHETEVENHDLKTI